jgi:hypothetical protein
MPRRKTHRDEIAGGRRPCITIAMPLDPAFGFAMVVFFFEDWIPHEYYSYAENLRGVPMIGVVAKLQILVILSNDPCNLGCKLT